MDRLRPDNDLTELKRSPPSRLNPTVPRTGHSG
jgi:hypothetical protein